MSPRRPSEPSESMAEQDQKSQSGDEVIDSSRRSFCVKLGLGLAGLVVGAEGCATTQIPVVKPDIPEIPPSDEQISENMGDLKRKLKARLTDDQKKKGVINCAYASSDKSNKPIKAARIKAESINNRVVPQGTRSSDIQIGKLGKTKIVCVYGEKNSESKEYIAQKKKWIELYLNVVMRIGDSVDTFRNTYKNPLFVNKVEVLLFAKMNEIISTFREIMSDNIKAPSVDTNGKAISQRVREISAEIMKKAIEDAKVSKEVIFGNKYERQLAEIRAGYSEMRKALNLLRKKLNDI